MWPRQFLISIFIKFEIFPFSQGGIKLNSYEVYRLVGPLEKQTRESEKKVTETKKISNRASREDGVGGGKKKMGV